MSDSPSSDPARGQMNHLFLRMTAKLALSLAAAFALADIFVVPYIRAQLKENIRSTLSAPLQVMALSLSERAGDPEFESIVDRTKARFPVPCTLVPRSQLALEPPESAILDAGEVVQTGHFLRSVLFVRVPRTELVIRLGPINPVHPLGQWRGPAVIGLLLCGLVGGMWLLVRPIERRIQALAATASELGRGNLAARSGERGRDPIGDLAARFNQMAGALQAHVQSREELLRHVSHELRMPVQRLHFSAERFREDLAPEDRETAIATMENELEELSRLIDELLSYARLRDQEVTTTEAVDVHATVAVTTQAHAELSDTVKATVDGPDAPRYANIEERVLRRAVSNLVGNAFRHARSRVHVSVTAAAGATHIDVDDDGAGVPEQDRERVFEPFTRLERSDVEGGDAGRRDHGFGLGLAIVRRIAERSRGTVSIETAPLGGARFRMTLPEARGPDHRSEVGSSR